MTRRSKGFPDWKCDDTVLDAVKAPWGLIVDSESGKHWTTEANINEWLFCNFEQGNVGPVFYVSEGLECSAATSHLLQPR